MGVFLRIRAEYNLVIFENTGSVSTCVCIIDVNRRRVLYKKRLITKYSYRALIRYLRWFGFCFGLGFFVRTAA